MDTQQGRINGQVECQFFLTLKCVTLTFFPQCFLNVCSVVIDFRINTSLDLKREISVPYGFSDVTGFIRPEFGPLHIMNCIFQNQY